MNPFEIDLTNNERNMFDGIADATVQCFAAAYKAGWWTDLNTGESLIGKRNHGEERIE